MIIDSEGREIKLLVGYLKGTVYDAYRSYFKGGWKRRNLTLIGKIHIVKTLGLSKLIYNASVSAVETYCRENF